MTEKSDQTVHVLTMGKPLCEFTPTVPGEWPPGHTWVAIWEADQATCKACREAFRLLTGQTTL